MKTKDPVPFSAAWYRKRAEEVRYKGKTISKYNHYLDMAEVIDLTEHRIKLESGHAVKS